ncbi:hypothetical protein B0H15DRAFT_958466 [Mycena belliarum]|uniref:Uncharacterized protein n=1 Tax=Mycena belliarum TaxID=1033014 RepID=A0AAD6TKG9_9AGAR|nr:hypothetical protein B0H15DRAFT_958466 [Mycena belliae]
MSLGELAVLWVKRARHLGQSLLRVVLVSYAVDLPANCVALLRTGIRVLMLNMIILAKASVMYGPYGPTSVPRFFVPAESTTLFGMAEGMNMETLYGSMLLNRHYSRFGYDFPGFPVADADLAKFGIHPLIKNAQLSRLLLDRNGKKHNFGDELLRYNPELGEEGRWVVALPSEELEKTRPNTPEDGDLSRISEGDEGEEQVDNAFCLVSTVSLPCISRRMAAVFHGAAPARVPFHGVFPWSRLLPTSLDMTSPSSLSGVSLASWSIFVVACRLRDISLTPEELQSYPCQPRETWPEFFENRLRPMIYFVHRAVTKDFTLVGRCGRYDDGELEEICYWVEVILLHCRLLLLSREDTASCFSDGWDLPFPRAWEIPGEATAMFETMYRLCMSVGFPQLNFSEMSVNKFTLLPLICEARRAQSRFATRRDYIPYNEKTGELEDPRWLDPWFGHVIEAGWWGPPREYYPKARSSHEAGSVEEITARVSGLRVTGGARRIRL